MFISLLMDSDLDQAVSSLNFLKRQRDFISFVQTGCLILTPTLIFKHL